MLTNPSKHYTMKKLYFAIIALLLSGLVAAQSQRMVLAEEFTNASCPPCASQNPAFNALLSSNVSKVISIKYQTNFPGADPMNAQTNNFVTPRLTYYSVTGVPFAVRDGYQLRDPSYGVSGYDAGPYLWGQDSIDNRYAVPSPYTLNVSHTYNATFDSIFISVEVICTQAVSGNLVLHTGLVEKQITFASAPGTNGEKEFYGVMRNMIPNANGTSLGTSWTVGQTQSYNFAIKVPTFTYSKGQLAIVCFIQDNTTFTGTGAITSGTKALTLSAVVPGVAIGTNVSGTGIAAGTTVSSINGTAVLLSDVTTATTAAVSLTFANKLVHQAAISEPIPLAIDAEVITSPSIDVTCTTSYTPSIDVKNIGTSVISSLDISYKLNTGTAVLTTWNGTIAVGNTVTIPLPTQSPLIAGVNTFSATITAVNGTLDNDAANNVYTKKITANLTSPILPPLVEGFNSTVFPPTNWTRINGGATYGWTRITTGYSASSGSAKMDFWFSPAGDVDEMYSPKLNLSNVTSATLDFKIAKAGLGGTENDRLEVLVSSDCGQNWTSVFDESGASLATLINASTAFTPTSPVVTSEWSINNANLIAFIGQPEVIVNFRATSDYGNNLYLDEININTVTGIDAPSSEQQISLFPTPTRGDVFINLESVKSNTVKISITDNTGKLVSEFESVKRDNAIKIDLSAQASGVYFVNINADGKIITKKVVLEK